MTAAPWMLTTPDVDHSKCANPACGRPLLGVRAWPVGLVTVATLGGIVQEQQYVLLACDDCARVFHGLAEPEQPQQPLALTAPPADGARS